MHCYPCVSSRAVSDGPQVSTEKMKGHTGGVLCLDAWKGVGTTVSNTPIVAMSGDTQSNLIVWDGRKRKALHNLVGHTDGKQHRSSLSGGVASGALCTIVMARGG